MSAPMPDQVGDDLPLVQLLTPGGERLEHPEFHYDGDDESIRGLYRDLVLARRIDTEAFALQRHGEIGLWPPALGQEAAQIGSGRAMRPQDFAFASYREHGVAWCRGVNPSSLLGWVRGAEHGGWDPADHGYGLPSIVIGAQTLHATGYAMGLTFDGSVGTGDPDRDAAVVTYFGDGAMSQGDVNESFAFAAVNHAPVVFFCQNNQWAISVPLSRQSTVPLAQRAEGFGFRGVRVDGNDVLACHAVTTAALQQARDGGGPMLIEAVTYRMGAHTTSDDPTRYREADEVEAWRAKDPIDRVAAYLRSHGTDETFFEDVEIEAGALGEILREECAAYAEPDLADQFDLVFAEQTDELRAQKAEFVAWRGQYEGSPA
jgi:2-oxoisovalerate dehydrogenase E1 component alpha subunit